MAKVHITLQGKGGVGKSLISAMMAQYKVSKGATPTCIDTDPVNATFAGFKALSVRRLEIMEGDEINPRQFDVLIEAITESKNDVIVDNGASSFVPLSHYLLSNDVPNLLGELGHELIIHTVVTGGQSLIDTVSGFAQLTNQFPAGSAFVVWLNPFWGPIEHEGRTFESLKAYRENKDKVVAIINIPVLKKELHGRDLADVLQDRLTFEEALALSTKPVMVRHRIKQVRDQMFGQIAAATVLG